jgi:hypothetical protein
VQSHGFLSEGIAGLPVQKRFGEGSGGGGGGSSRDVETLTKPRINRKDQPQKTEDESKLVSSFLEDDDSGDDKPSFDEMAPVKLNSGA